MVKRYRPIKWSAKTSDEEITEDDDLPSAIAAIMDEDLEFETPPEFRSSDFDSGQRVHSIPEEEEEFFSIRPDLLQQQQYGLPPLRLESQDSCGPYYSLVPSQVMADQSAQSFLLGHRGARLVRMSSQGQQPKSLAGTSHYVHSQSVQPSSLPLNRMQSSNIGGVRRVLQNMARAITKELHLD